MDEPCRRMGVGVTPAPGLPGSEEQCGRGVLAGPSRSGRRPQTEAEDGRLLCSLHTFPAPGAPGSGQCSPCSRARGQHGSGQSMSPGSVGGPGAAASGPSTSPPLPSTQASLGARGRSHLVHTAMGSIPEAPTARTAQSCHSAPTGGLQDDSPAEFVLCPQILRERNPLPRWVPCRHRWPPLLLAESLCNQHLGTADACRHSATWHFWSASLGRGVDPRPG